MSAPLANRTGDLTTGVNGVQLTPVKSTNIQALGWSDGVLHVEFSGGKRFSYSGISNSDYQSLLDSKSIGAHFAKHIRPKHKGNPL